MTLFVETDTPLTTEPAPKVATLPVRAPREIRVVSDPIAVLDTGRFEHMQRIATVMAESNLIPDALFKEKMQNADGKEVMGLLPIKTVVSNCFLIVNQAVRWGMDPFAVAQCVSVVHGKLCYEGKLIAAVLNAGLSVDLEYTFNDKIGDAMEVTVSAAINGKPVTDSKGAIKAISGTVADWKTTNSGSPWAARGGHMRMLRYRGAREWARVHAPGMMLGVYSDDEMEDETVRNVRDVTPPMRPPPPDDEPAGDRMTEKELLAGLQDLGVGPPPEGGKPPAGATSAPDAALTAAAARRPPPPDDAQTMATRPPDGTSQTSKSDFDVIDPEAALRWINDQLAVGVTGDALETIWNSVVDPVVQKLFPPDQEEAHGLLRKHMRRVEP